MKNKRLLDLIEHIDQAYVAEAKPKRRGVSLAWQRWGAVAAAFVLLVGTVTGGYYIFQKIKDNEIPNPDLVSYMDYNGPVLPLTAMENLDGIAVEREVAYDFSTGKAAITDQYVLKNTSGEAKTSTLLYPFGASLSDDLEALPQITVNGTAMETTLYPGAASKLKKTGTTGEKVGWNEYQALLEDGSYQAAAFADYPALNQSIVVYEISNVDCNGEGENPTLNVEFEMDYNKTTIMTYGMNGAKNDVNRGAYSRHFSVSETGNHYLVVLGEDLEEYTLQGYKDGGCDRGEEIDITATVNRRETTLGAFLQERLAEVRIPNSSGDIRDAVSREAFFGLVAQQLQEGILTAEGTAKFNFDILEDAINSAHYAQRVIYVTFDVTIPAGEQITVESSFVKEAHRDYVVSGGTKQGNAYDIATQLGSNLVFASQKLSVSGMETLEIKGQNLGLDLKNGITQVTLDNTEAYYWMELQETVETTEEPTQAPTEVSTLTPITEPTIEPTPTNTLAPTPTVNTPVSTSTAEPTKAPTSTPKPTVSVAPTVEKWDGSVATQFASGTGSASNPYCIENGAQLAYLAKQVNNGSTYAGKYFVLTKDIDLNHKEWTSIGNGATPFQGYLDGGSHTISNLKMTKAISYTNSSTGSKWAFAGLFGTCKDASILNLMLDTVSITISNGSTYDYTAVGAVVGHMTSTSNVVVSNVKTKDVTIKVAQNYTVLYIGGCMGYLSVQESGWFEGDALQSMATLTGEKNEESSYIGGILGYLSNKGTTELSNFVTYSRINWPYHCGSNYAGAIGAVNNVSGSIKLSNAFSQIRTGTYYNESSNTYAYHGKAIIGAAFRPQDSKATYKCQNLFGNIAEYLQGSAIGYELYYISIYLTETNCQGCTTLPVNHGLNSNIWDLSSLSNPVLK